MSPHEDLTPEQIELARERIKKWPLEEREAMTRMSNEEVQSIMHLTALLDITPVEVEATGTTLVFDLRNHPVEPRP